MRDTASFTLRSHEYIVLLGSRQIQLLNSFHGELVLCNGLQEERQDKREAFEETAEVSEHIEQAVRLP